MAKKEVNSIVKLPAIAWRQLNKLKDGLRSRLYMILQNERSKTKVQNTSIVNLI